MQTIQELSVVGRSLNARPALRAVHGGDEEQAPSGTEVDNAENSALLATSLAVY